MSDVQRLRLEAWLRFAPHIPRADELVAPDGSAYCWLGGAALMAARHATSRITLNIPGEQVGDAHFTVDGAALPEQHDEPLMRAMATWYGVDLWDVTVDPDSLPSWLADEINAGLERARETDEKQWWVYQWARDGGGWSLTALSDLGIPGWTLAVVTREVLNLDRTVVYP